MRVGRLVHPVTVQRQATTQDSAGQQTQTWSTLASRTVAMRTLNGREYFNASGERAETVVEIRMRYDATTATIRPFDRILDATPSPNRVYDILSINDVDERRHELVMQCRRVA